MKNKDKKSRKKLFVTLALLFGLAGVGTAAFAGYVLSDPKITNPEELTPGEIVVENRTYGVTADLEEAELYFYPTSAVNEGRVQYDGNPASNLDLNLSFTIDDPNNYLEGKTLTVTVTTTSSDDAVSNNYITLPTVQETTVTSGAAKAVTLAWGWGTAFNNTDPCQYFNEGGAGEAKELGDADDTIADGTVNGILNDFKTKLAATNFQVTVAEKTA